MKPEDKKYILENINSKSVKEIACDLNLKERKIRKFLRREKEKPRHIDSQPEEKKPFKKTTLLAAVLLIVILGLAVYSSSLNGEFLWDDYYLVKDNTFIKNFTRIPDIFKNDIAAGAGKEANSYRPLQILTYLLDYSLWRLDVRGYHLTNIILHILAALSLYWLINILFGDRLLSFVVSLLFIAHPIHTEAVAYISGRADSLAAVFMFLCLALYIKYIHLQKNTLYILMLLSYVLALLSRENSLIIPVLLLLYHYSFKKKINIKGFVSMAIVALLYILIRGTALRLSTLNLSSGTNLLERIPGFFVAITSYIRLMFLPFGLHMEYGAKLFKIANPEAVAGMLILISLLVYGFKKRNTNGLVFFSIYWFFITLLPSSNLYPINAYMAEHWLYIPSIGLFLILANGACYLYRNKNLKIPAIAVIAALIVFYSSLTIKQNTRWRKARAFYSRVLEFDPENIRALNSLGLIHYGDGRIEDAISLYKKAIEVEPYYLDAYNNLGIAYRNSGRPREAIAIYKKAIKINPKFVYTYCNLANAYKDIGNRKEALALYKKAIEIYPDFAYAYNNIALLYENTGRNQEAIEMYKKAIELKPNYAEAYNNLGGAYHAIGNNREAIATYKKAIKIKPSHVKVYSNLGVIYSTLGKEAEAIAAYKKAIEVDPDYAAAHFNLSVSYFGQKQYGLAIRHYDKAVQGGRGEDPEFSRLLEPYRK